MRVVQLITQSRGGPVDHAVDVAIELDHLGHESHLVGPPGDLGERVVGTGVAFHGLTLTSKFDLAGARRLSRLLATINPDVLHCQDRRAGLIGRPAARQADVPVVYTLHGVPDPLAQHVAGNLGFAPQSRRVTLANRQGERWLARATKSLVITPCDAVTRYAHDYVGIPRDQLVTVHNGISPTWGGALTPREDYRHAPVTAAWLGVMQPVKRVPALVRAVAEVDNLHLTLIGNGPEHQRIVDEIVSAELIDRVVLAGYQSNPAPWLDSSDIFVLPSAAEACPMALLQAMLRGIPVVASRAGGIPEVVRHGVEGLLFDAGDDLGLRDALCLLTKDADLRRELGAQARKRVLTTFSTQKCVDSLLGTYQEAGA